MDEIFFTTNRNPKVVFTASSSIHISEQGYIRWLIFKLIVNSASIELRKPVNGLKVLLTDILASVLSNLEIIYS
jgi:hypothetical protein